LALLGGLGLYGHHTEWKLPKFSTLAGTASPVRDDWCAEHSVPESQCVICSPDLLPRGEDHGWCHDHGVHNCPLHHPDVAQLKRSPVISQADMERAARALAIAERPANNSVCKNYLRPIQFASLEAVQKAGVDVELVERQPIVESIAASGEISYDETRFANLSSRAAGTVCQVVKNVGDQVQAGDILAIVDSVDVGRAKTELIRALAQETLQEQTRTRLTSLSSSGVVAGRRVQEVEAEYAHARAAVLSAQQSLHNLGLPVNVEQLRGMPEAELVEHLRRLGLQEAFPHTLASSVPTANALPIRAPMDGVIVAREVVVGEVVDASHVLFQVADTTQMWLTVSVPLEDAARLEIGQPVRFQPDGNHEEVSGSLVWISTAADPETRMVKVRAELPNAFGQLRDETFGSGQIILREEQDAIVVPNKAVHWEGCCHVVFVRDKGYFDREDSPKVFHIRTVRLGATTEKHTEVIAGVLPNEVVATNGSDVLRAELLKNNLGEGCTCGG
jgi:multidrug efflux pump subunit AcrA (membrane-fusion protein)